MNNDFINVAVFPYDNEMYPYLQHSSMLKNINIQILLSPNGWAVERENICGYTLQTTLSEDDYQKIDAVWITGSANKIQDDQICEVLEDMLKHGKKVLFARVVQEPVYSKILQLVKKYSGNMIDVMKANEISDIDISPLALHDIYTPIICVAGVGEQTGKFEVQLAIKRYLEENGYHAILVSSRNDSVFLNNTYSFPDFMDSNIPSEQKIILYNHFIKKIEQEERPEVIILGVPEGIMPISKFQVGYFGIHAFEILNAVNPDFLVMCLYGNNVSDKYVSEMKQIVKYKYMSDIDCFYLSDTAQDVFTVNRSIPIEYFSRKQADIENLRTRLAADTDGLEKIFTKTSVESMGQYIIECLNENVEMELL